MSAKKVFSRYRRFGPSLQLQKHLMTKPACGRRPAQSGLTNCPLARAHWRKSRQLWTSPLRATLRSSSAACGLRTVLPTPFFYATSFAEVVLSPAATDAAHPAFSKLFLESEIDESLSAILVTRRPSVPKDGQPWLFSVARCNQAAVGKSSFETDRMRFVRTRPGVKGGFCDTAGPRLLCTLTYSRLRLPPKPCPEPSPLPSRSSSLLSYNSNEGCMR